MQMHDVFEFEPVAEGAAGGDDRVLELDAGELDAQIRRNFGVGWARAQGRPPWRRRNEAGFSSLAGLGGFGDRSGGGASLSPRCGGASASFRTRPTAWVGALIPSRDANVTARS